MNILDTFARALILTGIIFTVIWLLTEFDMGAAFSAGTVSLIGFIILFNQSFIECTGANTGT